MHGITTDEIAMFALIWAVAFASTIARSVRDGDSRSLSSCAALGSTAGFLAVGIVAVWIDRGANGTDLSNPWFWIGLSALIGGLGKEQDRLRLIVWNSVAQSFQNSTQPAPPAKDRETGK